MTVLEIIQEFSLQNTQQSVKNVLNMLLYHNLSDMVQYNALIAVFCIEIKKEIYLNAYKVIERLIFLSRLILKFSS